MPRRDCIALERGAGGDAGPVDVEQHVGGVLAVYPERVPAVGVGAGCRRHGCSCCHFAGFVRAVVLLHGNRAGSVKAEPYAVNDVVQSGIRVRRETRDEDRCTCRDAREAHARFPDKALIESEGTLVGKRHTRILCLVRSRQCEFNDAAGLIGLERFAAACGVDEVQVFVTSRALPMKSCFPEDGSGDENAVRVLRRRRRRGGGFAAVLTFNCHVWPPKPGGSSRLHRGMKAGQGWMRVVTRWLWRTGHLHTGRR
ncbi:MAG: hypothetical protein MZV70_64125 [Desulfobacterales bacterium]|nr:hypothetical protein [Desulfobacterales bacterium]